MQHAIRLTIVLLSLLLLAGCSQTHQNLRLSPTPPDIGQAVSSGASVALQVVDARDGRDLGMLENPDGSLVRLTADQNIDYTLQLAAAEALREYGFRPTLWSDSAVPRIEIRIEVLEHEVKAGVPYALATEVALAGTAWAGRERYTSRARSTLNRQRPLPPSASTNAEIISTAMSQALGQLLDEGFVGFIHERR